jgi:hypothetical protein
MIKIYDNVLHTDALNFINNGINNLIWTINFKSSSKQGTLKEAVINGQGTCNFIDEEENITWPDDTSFQPEFNYKFFYRYFLEHICNAEKWNKENVLAKIYRSFITITPQGLGREMHTDYTGSNDMSVIFYPQKWNESYKGATVFETSEIIEYKQNRLALYYGSAPHRASEHFNPNNRYVFVTKLNLTIK